MEYDEVLERARKLAEERKPGAGSAKHAAFANSVAYAVTGWSGGFGGPSVREHAAARICRPYQDFDRAVEVLISETGPIFGQLTDIHRYCWLNEHCFDNDPEDIRELSSSESE